MIEEEEDMSAAQKEANEIARKAVRKQQALRERKLSPWRGVRMFGLVGWAVAVPTIMGVALGIWIDTWATSRISWTLALLLAGVTVGCVNAWYWVQKELADD